MRVLGVVVAVTVGCVACVACAACACAEPPAARTCNADTECYVGERCDDGVCAPVPDDDDGPLRALDATLLTVEDQPAVAVVEAAGADPRLQIAFVLDDADVEVV